MGVGPGRAIGAALLGVAMLSACSAPESSRTPTPPPSAPEVSSASASSESTATAPGSPAPGAPTATWESRPDAPVARLEMAVAAHQGRIWLAGGLDAFGAALTDVEIYDPATETWTDGPGLPTPLHHAALVSTGEELLVIGGYAGSSFSAPTDAVLRLAATEDAWEPATSLPGPRAAGAAAWDGSRVLYAGGVSPTVHADVFVLVDGAWQSIGLLSAAREHLAATSDGEGTVWLLGGRQGSLATNLATVDVATEDGVAPGGELPTPRGGVAAFFASGVGACLSGGEAPEGAFDVVECIGADGELATLPASSQRRHGHGAAVVDGVAFLLLGGPQPGLAVSSTIESLDLALLTPGATR